MDVVPASGTTHIVTGAMPAGRRMEKRLADILDGRLQRRTSGEPEADFANLDTVCARLQRFITERVDGPFSIDNFARLSGGGANESYRFTFTHGGETSLRVLRIKARGGCTEGDILGEFQVMVALQGVLPLPKPYWVANDREYFGSPALISSFESGVQAPPSDVVVATGVGVAYGPTLRKMLGPRFVEYEARLHAFDWRGGDLTAFDMPRPGTTDAIDWRLAFWDRVWDEDKFEDHPTVLFTREWLWNNRPVVDHVSVLHGDYRNGNFLFNLEQGEITSILDWELCTLGDRHCDLAYTMFRDFGHLDENGIFLNSGLMDTESFIRQYEEVSGLKVDPERLRYYLVYNCYWVVVSLFATGPRNAEAGLTQLDLFYNVLTGLGSAFMSELDRLLWGARA